jgi:NADPH:quinone reductase-like Zn-dependent oxidoreductase
MAAISAGSSRVGSEIGPERLKVLGASDVINYIETPDWDEKARELTDGRGVDCVVEIGGPGTIAMSLKALAVGGHISLIGWELVAVGGRARSLIADRPRHYDRLD